MRVVSLVNANLKSGRMFTFTKQPLKLQEQIRLFRFVDYLHSPGEQESVEVRSGNTFNWCAREGADRCAKFAICQCRLERARLEAKRRVGGNQPTEQQRNRGCSYSSIRVIVFID
ncbi:hypothetical protein M514_12199 [Trichuris suis]|uniref:Uncharacterized protein n=1 Tax=Trichuris suis TaxID=68888 RepID=A0A085LPL3_9BILA|nr:hypothetical protein M513_12199 [Trichuris suis]KFD64257.1 hypothetical protein M514_12199 [Trichuris suis]